MLFRSVSIVFVISLVGCAKPMIWDKEGGTQREFNADNYDCQKDVRQSGYYGNGLIGTLNMKAFFQQCMVARGYTLRE